MKHAQWFVPIALGLALNPTLGATKAQNAVVTLELNAAQSQPLSSTALSGYNFGNYMNAIEFPKQLRALEPTLLRFPAGNVGDDQDLSEASLTVFKANLSIFGVLFQMAGELLFSCRQLSLNQKLLDLRRFGC